MNITFQKESVSRELKRMGRLLGKKGPAHLRAVWLEPCDRMLRITVHGGDASCTVGAPAQCAPGPVFGIEDGLKFFALLSKLDNGDISIQVKEAAVVVQGRRRFRLNLLDPSWAPVMNPVPKKTVPIDGRAVCEALGAVEGSISPDPAVDGAMACAFIDATEGGVALVGLCGHSMGIARPMRTGLEVLGGSILISRPYLPFFKDFIKDRDCSLPIAHGRLIMVSADFTSKAELPLDQGEYPDYAGIMPQNFDCGMVFDREEMLEALDRLAVVSTLESMAFGLALQGEEVALRLESEQGSGSEVVPGRAEGASLEREMFFILPDFAAALVALPGDGPVLLKTTDSIGPALLAAADMPAVANIIIMPVEEKHAQEEVAKD